MDDAVVMLELWMDCVGCVGAAVRRAGPWFAIGVLFLITVGVSVQAQASVIDFATANPDFLIEGQAARERLGTDLASGDLDADGIDDLVIGAPWSHRSGAEQFAGRVYIFFGERDGAGSVRAGNADVTVVGAAALDQIGGGVDRQPGTLAVGDVNGDRVGDLVLGVPDAQGRSGEVRIIFGRDRTGWEASPIIDLAATPGDVVISVAGVRSWLGMTVAVGDVDGDGIGDLVAGAPGADGLDSQRRDAGEVYVFLGRETWPATLVAEADADVRVVGAQPGDLLGSGLAVGRLAGAEADDVAIGARGGDGPADDRTMAGEVHVLFGSAGLTGLRDLSVTPADWVIYAAASTDRAGRYLAVGDVSGDGQPDLVIGLPDGDGPANGRTDAGEVAVLFGPAVPGTITDLADGADFLLYGPQGFTPQQPGGRLGDNVALGDVNADGVLDLVAGSRQGNGSNGARPNAGEAYVVFGGGLPEAIDLSGEDADIAIYGRSNNDMLGRASVGNLDGVPPHDVALSAPDADVSDDGVLTDAGQVFVVYRQVAAPTPTSTSPVTTTPEPTITLTPTATSTAIVTPTPTTSSYLPLIMRNHSTP